MNGPFWSLAQSSWMLAHGVVSPTRQCCVHHQEPSSDVACNKAVLAPRLSRHVTRDHDIYCSYMIRVLVWKSCTYAEVENSPHLSPCPVPSPSMSLNKLMQLLLNMSFDILVTTQNILSRSLQHCRNTAMQTRSTVLHRADTPHSH